MKKIENCKKSLKVILLKDKKQWRTKTILEKNNKVGGSTLPNFKTVIQQWNTGIKTSKSTD